VSVVVESNFVLELVLEQEQSASCIELLEMAEAGAIQLIVPAYSIMEPYETLGRRHRDRKKIRTDLNTELAQLSRSSTAAAYVQASADVLALLIDSADAETQKIAELRQRLCAAATIIPLTIDILVAASAYQVQHDLSPQDAVVYASVIAHLTADAPAEGCFISRNSSDFDDPDIRAELSALACKYLTRFDAAVEYLKRPRK
jgi:predicted nucleic acid-binding protein